MEVHALHLHCVQRGTPLFLKLQGILQHSNKSILHLHQRQLIYTSSKTLNVNFLGNTPI